MTTAIAMCPAGKHPHAYSDDHPGLHEGIYDAVVKLLAVSWCARCNDSAPEMPADPAAEVEVGRSVIYALNQEWRLGPAAAFEAYLARERQRPPDAVWNGAPTWCLPDMPHGRGWDDRP